MASIFQSFPILRRAAPRLTKELFTCNACPRRTFITTQPKSPITSRIQQLNGRSNFGRRWNSTANAAGEASALSEGAAKAQSSKVFPETNSKGVAIWLLGSAASVFGIVVFGGLTRLTESGLSITEWKPVTGSLPPRSQEDWESEFEKYRASPEFKVINSGMSLEEFKKIYWMEWGHRLWGRFIGVTFAIPTLYFIARRKVTRPMAARLLGICGLIGFQGVIGWWMVKSGLKDDLLTSGNVPRVSQYRLTAHLGAAFVVYLSMLVNGLSILRENRLLKNPQAGLELVKTLQHPHLRIFRGSVTALCGLAFVTAMSGALVAGLDAGLIYNEFPYMGVGLTPPKKELWDPFYSHTSDNSDLWWRNMLENPSLVQLDHRIMAMSTLTGVLSLVAYSRYAPSVRSLLPANAKRGVTGVMHVVLMQVALGISTLLYLVPTHLAATHQAGALALLSMAFVLRTRVAIPKRTIGLLQKAAKGPSFANTPLNKSLNQTVKSA